MAISSTLSASERKSCAKKIRIPPPRPFAAEFFLGINEKKTRDDSSETAHGSLANAHAQWRLSLPSRRNAGNACMHEGMMMKGILLDVFRVQRMKSCPITRKITQDRQRKRVSYCMVW